MSLESEFSFCSIYCICCAVRASTQLCKVIKLIAFPTLLSISWGLFSDVLEATITTGTFCRFLCELLGVFAQLSLSRVRVTVTLTLR